MQNRQADGEFGKALAAAVVEKGQSCTFSTIDTVMKRQNAGHSTRVSPSQHTKSKSAMPFFKRFFARRRLRRDEKKAQPQTEQRSVIYYAYEVFTDDPEEPVADGKAASARSSNLSDLSAPSLLPPPAFDEKIDSSQKETESEEDSSLVSLSVLESSKTISHTRSSSRVP